MIEKIRKIYLYAGATPAGELASAEAKQWLDDNQIPHEHLWYGDPLQHPEVFSALGTWRFGSEVQFSDFPFVIYNEIHDSGEVIMQCLYGLDSIINSNLKELVELG